MAPGDHRVHPPVDGVEHHAANLLGNLVHVHVRVGLVADQGGAVLDHRGGEVAVEVAGDRDREIGCDGAHPPQQLAFPVEHMLGRHRTVQVEQGRVAAIRDGVAHQPRHPFVGVLAHRPRGHRLRRERGDDLRAPLAGQRHVRGDGHARRAVRLLHGFAGMRTPRLESRPVGDDRREGVGLVLHHRDDDAHQRHLLEDRCQRRLASRHGSGKDQVLDSLRARRRSNFGRQQDRQSPARAGGPSMNDPPQAHNP